MQQQQLDQQKQIAAAQMQQEQLKQQQDMTNQNYQNELDRINKKEIALIAAEAKGGPLTDIDQSGTPDVLETSKLTHEQEKLSKDYSLRMADIQSKNMQNLQKKEKYF